MSKPFSVRTTSAVVQSISLFVGYLSKEWLCFILLSLLMNF